MKTRAVITTAIGVLCGCIMVFALCSCSSTEKDADLYPVEVDGDWGYIDRAGQIAVFPQFEYADGFSEGLAAVKLEKGWGLVNTSGTLVYLRADRIEARCLSIGLFSEGLATQSVRFPGMDPDTSVFYCDTTGETAFERSFFGGRPFHEGLAAVQVSGMALMGGGPEEWGYIGKDGAYVVQPQFESAGDFSEGLACVAKDGRYGYIDHTGAFVIDQQFNSASPFSEGLAAVVLGHRSGYVDKHGDWDIELPDGTTTRSAQSVFSDGRAAVWRGEQAGYINKHGDMVIEPQFYDAASFAEGLAAVCPALDGPWGYIDKDGVMVIPPQFEKAEAFSDGVARAYKGREPTNLVYIDKDGRVIWEGPVEAVADATVSPPRGVEIDAPSPRSGQAMVFDPVTGNLLLFGGMDDAGCLDDACVWDPVTSTWMELDPTGDRPPGCWTPVMVFDPSNGRAILFDGWPNRSSYTYNPATNTWAQLVTSGGSEPRPYSGYSMVYDPDLARMIRFGGGLVDPPGPLDGTWCFNPATSTWTRLDPEGDVPGARRLHSMVYDASAHKVIMFGGIDDATPYYGGLDETWAYDPAANAWTHLEPQGENPPSRSCHSMVWDPVSHRVILFGGQGEEGYLNDTWAYDFAANTWTRLDTSGGQPTARVWHSMVYEPHSHRMVLFGGEGARGYLNDMWAYDPAQNTWTRLSAPGL